MLKVRTYQKIISVLLVVSFMNAEISMGIPQQVIPIKESTLQIMVGDNPIIKTIGREYVRFIDREIASIVATFLNDPDNSYVDINSELDELYIGTPRGDDKRLLRVVSKPVKTENVVVMYLEELKSGRKNRFKVTVDCDKWADIKSGKGRYKVDIVSSKNRRKDLQRFDPEREAALKALDERQFKSIKETFPKELMQHFSGVKNVEVVNRMSTPTREIGDVEEKTIAMIHASAQAIISAEKYRSDKTNPFLGVLADNKAVESIFDFLRKSSFSKMIKGVIRLAETQRYGVQGGLQEGEIFGTGDREIDMGIDPLSGSHNVSRPGSVSSYIAAVEKGGLRGIPDELFMNNIVIKQKGNFSNLKMGSVPDGAALKRLAKQLEKPVNQLRVIIPLGQRHIGNVVKKKGEPEHLINALVEAGIQADITDYKGIKEEVEKHGFYKNGNIIIVRNTFMSVFALMNDSADMIMGAGSAMASAQIAFALKAFDRGQGRFNLVSYQKLKDKKSHGDWPNLLAKRKDTKIDEGILRQHGIKRKDIHTKDDLIRTGNGAMIVAGLKDCDLWVAGMNDPKFNDDMTEVEVSVLWMGLSGDIKVLRVTYETVVGKLLAEINAQEKQIAQSEEILKKDEVEVYGRNKKLSELHFKLARTYLKFGNLDDAMKCCEKADSLVAESLYEYQDYSLSETFKSYASALKILRREGPDEENSNSQKSEEMLRSDALKAMSTLNSTDNQDYVDDVLRTRPSVAEFVRKLNQGLGDDYLEKYIDVYRESDRTEKEYKQIRPYFAFAHVYYTRALKFFPKENKRTKREQMEFELYTALRDLAKLFRDDENAYTGEADHYGNLQSFIAAMDKQHIMIAQLYAKNGFNQRAIRYYKRAAHDKCGMKDLRTRVGGLYPLSARFDVPELYESRGWYERAREEYIPLMSKEYISSVFGLDYDENGKGGFGGEMTYQITAVAGYIANDILCLDKVNSPEKVKGGDKLIIDYLRSKLENLFGRYKDFSVKGNDDKGQIWGITKDGTEELIWNIRSDGHFGLPAHGGNEGILKEVRRLRGIFEQVDMGYLAAEWKGVCKDLGVEGEYTVKKVFKKITKQYSDKGRYNHTLVHIEFMLKELGKLNLEAEKVNMPELKLAIFFHNSVYALNDDNKKKSAAFAVDQCAKLGIKGNVVEEVGALIRSTEGYRSEQTHPSAQLLSDLDRAFYGSAQKITSISMERSGEQLFNKFETEIRQEHVYAGKGNEYVKQRLKGLRLLKKMGDDLFQREDFRDKYGDKSKENIEKLIGLLETEQKVHDGIFKPKDSKDFTAFNYMGMKTAIFPGYFKGFGDLDLDVINRAIKTYDRVVILVMPPKKGTVIFGGKKKIVKGKVEDIYSKVKDLKNVSVFGVESREMIADLMQLVNAKTTIRKLKNIPTSKEQLKHEASIAKEFYDRYGIDPTFMTPSLKYMKVHDSEQIKPLIKKFLELLARKFPNNGIVFPSEDFYKKIYALRNKNAIGKQVSQDVAFYSGSFDPITNAHLEVIVRASELYKKVYIGVENHKNQEYAFRVSRRIKMLEDTLKALGIKNVEVSESEGFTVDEAALRGAGTLIRGAAGIESMEEELPRAWANLTMDRRMTVALPTPHKYPKVTFKDLMEKINSGEDISGLVPTTVFWEIRRLERKIREREKKDLMKTKKEKGVTILGLLGGSESGKKTALRHLKRKGKVFTIDFDELNSKAQKEPEVIEEIVDVLGRGILDEDGNLDRAKLRKEVFGDTKKMALLTRVMHPILSRMGYDLIEKAIEDGYKVIVVEGIGIIKARLDKILDSIIFVDVPEEERIKRTLASDKEYKKGYTEEEARLLIKKQRLLVEEARNNATYIIDNGPAITERDFLGQIDAYISRFLPQDKLDKKVEKNIKDTHRFTSQLFDRIQEKVKAAEVSGNNTKINIILDLTLMPKESLEANIEIWSGLILLCKDFKNVNFVFERYIKIFEKTNAGNVPNHLKAEFFNSPDKTFVHSLLLKSLNENAGFCGIDAAAVKELYNTRIVHHKRAREISDEKSIDIPIISKKLAEWAREHGTAVDPNEYPVVMENPAFDVVGAERLMNFEAALITGLAKATLILTQQEDEDEFSETEEEIRESLNALYNVLMGGEINIFGEKTLRRMIDPTKLLHRLNVAIDTVLPSMSTMPISELAGYHKLISDLLRYA